MPQLLRTVRQNRWLKDTAAPFLAVDDVPADALGDLRTEENCLSVWEVHDQPSIERVVRALAVGGHSVQPMGYVLFDSDKLPAGIEIQVNMGVTPDRGANHWHRDLAVSGNKLVALTKVILQSGTTGTILKKRLRELVVQGVEKQELPDSVLSKLRG